MKKYLFGFFILVVPAFTGLPAQPAAGTDSRLTPLNLPVTFEDATVNYDLVDFGGNASVIQNDPVASGNKVCKTTKTASAVSWAGTTLGGTTGGFATAVPFAPGSTTMSMRVYSPDAGVKVRMKVEDPLDGTKSVETDAFTTVANAWETLVFDFANNAAGTPAINYSYNYKKLSVFFNFGVTGATAGAKTYYWDDVAFGGSAIPYVMVTFQVENPDSVPVYLFGNWDNWGNWPGAPMSFAGSGFYSTTIPLQAGNSYEFLYVNGIVPYKEILNPAWPCTNGNPTYTNRVLQLGTSDTTICYTWELCNTCNAPVITQVDLPVTFDEPNVNYDLVDFGGNASAIQADPVAPQNKVCRTLKTSSAVSWAGTTIGGTTGGFANPIPFTPEYTKMSMKVYSPDAGIPVRMKVEDSQDGTKSVETDAFTTVANAWETLQFDFSTPAAGTPALNFSYTYKKCSVFFNFGVAGSVSGAKTYYFDDVVFNGPAPTYINVTFQVKGTDSVPVYVFGNWDNWTSWPGVPMTPVGSGYEATISLKGGHPIEYLFVNGTGPTKEVLDPSWPCTNGNAQYTNRMSTLGLSDTTICYTWESCESCVITSAKSDISPEVRVILSSKGFSFITEENAQIENLAIFDLIGRNLYTSSRPIQGNTFVPLALTPGSVYFFRIMIEGKAVVLKGLVVKN